jgi:hypothetical protein
MSGNPPAPPSAEAIKARVISHMNKDHTYELSHYLRAYNGLSASASRDPQLTDLQLDGITVKSASGTHHVPISPPMNSFADSRVRMVEMAQTAQQRLGISDIRIRTFEPPRGPGIYSFAGVLSYFVSAGALGLGLLRPDTRVWQLLDQLFPGGAGGFVWLVKAIFVPVLLIHVTEAWWIANTRLAKHGIDTGSRLWLLWVLDTFFEGAPAMWRFDSLVDAERKKKEGAKH